MKKILNISLWALAVVAIITAVFFTRKHYAEKKCVKLNIDIDYTQQGRKSDVFLTYDDVQQFIHHRFDSIVGKPMGQINAEEIERKAREIPYVLDADVFKSLNGEVSLNIRQRRAIVMIIDPTGDRYYIDESGDIIPPRPGFPANILVCNGNIPAYKFYGANNTKAYKDSIMQNSILGDIYRLAKKLDADKFLQKEIVQLYIDHKQEINMIPLVGRHKIIFGRIENLDNKLKKLNAFYRKAKYFDAWGKYKSINLKYKNQIVCTKY